MSVAEMQERLNNLSEQIDPMPEEQKSYLLGFMEGVCQMSEKNRKETESKED